MNNFGSNSNEEGERDTIINSNSRQNNLNTRERERDRQTNVLINFQHKTPFSNVTNINCNVVSTQSTSNANSNHPTNANANEKLNSNTNTIIPMNTPVIDKNSRYNNVALQWKKGVQEKTNLMREENEKNLENLRNIKKISKNSEEIAKEIEKKIFIEIFKIIDFQNNDEISGEIDLNKFPLPNKVKEFISPLIEELKEESETLNINEFILACHELFNV